MFRMLATVDWYSSIGVKLVRQNEEDGESNWAKLTFGSCSTLVESWNTFRFLRHSFGQPLPKQLFSHGYACQERRMAAP